jgi:hypothetical protein
MKITRKKVLEFKKRVLELEEEFGIGIGHEDPYGAFILFPFSNDLNEWFSEAIDKASEEAIKAAKDEHRWIERQAKKAQKWLDAHPECLPKDYR